MSGCYDIDRQIFLLNLSHCYFSDLTATIFTLFCLTSEFDDYSSDSAVFKFDFHTLEL